MTEETKTYNCVECGAPRPNNSAYCDDCKKNLHKKFNVVTMNAESEIEEICREQY